MSVGTATTHPAGKRLLRARRARTGSPAVPRAPVAGPTRSSSTTAVAKPASSASSTARPRLVRRDLDDERSGPAEPVRGAGDDRLDRLEPARARHQGLERVEVPHHRVRAPATRAPRGRAGWRRSGRPARASAAGRAWYQSPGTELDPCRRLGRHPRQVGGGDLERAPDQRSVAITRSRGPLGDERERDHARAGAEVDGQGGAGRARAASCGRARRGRG